MTNVTIDDTLLLDHPLKGSYKRCHTSSLALPMSQHFLLSAPARTLSLAKVMRLTDAEAFETFKQVRWPGGKPFCPRCGCVAVYEYKSRRLFKCKGCNAQFSVTTDTIFASRKLPLRDLLAAIAICVNGAKGVSALQLSRDLDCQYKTSYVLCHKIREAIAAEMKGRTLEGQVEVDGAHFGGHVKPENRIEDRQDRRLLENRSGKRRVVVVMRERNGKALPFVCFSESESVPTIRARVAKGSTVYADESRAWDVLHTGYETKRINHKTAYSTPEASTNWAESYFSRLRRAEIGTHHRIAGPYLGQYAAEMAWREDHRRLDNGSQYLLVAGATMHHPVSRQWKGYWQRAA